MLRVFGRGATNHERLRTTEIRHKRTVKQNDCDSRRGLYTTTRNLNSSVCGWQTVLLASDTGRAAESERRAFDGHFVSYCFRLLRNRYFNKAALGCLRNYAMQHE